MGIMQLINGSVSTPALLPGNVALSVPRPGVVLQVDNFTTATQIDQVFVDFWTNQNNGKVRYLVSTSAAAKLQSECTQEIEVQPGASEASPDGFSPGATYHLHYFYEFPDGTTFPSGTATIHHGSTVTLPATETIASSISPSSLSISETLGVGQTVTTLVANTSGNSFTEITDASNKFTVLANGTVQLSAAITVGVYTLRVQATNTAGSYQQDITITVTAAPGGGGTGLEPDTTAATQAALNAILDNWENNWASTIPAGKVVTDGRVIEISAPITGNLVVSNRTFPQLVTIKGKGAWTQQTVFPWKASNGSTISGSLNMTNCTRVSFYGLAASNWLWTGNNFCSHERCAIQGVRGANDDVAPTTVGNSQYSNNHTLKDCLITGFKGVNLHIQYPGGAAGSFDNLLIDGCIFDKMQADAIQVNLGYNQGTAFVADGWQMIRCVFLDFILSAGAHPDYFQCWRGTLNNFYAWGNLFMQTRGDTVSGVMNGGVFFSDFGRSPGLICQQNICAMAGYNCLAGIGSGATSVCSDNLMTNRSFGPVGTYQQNTHNPHGLGFSSRDRNLVTLSYAGAEAIGPNGVGIVIGNVWNGVVPNVAGMLVYLTAYPTDTTDIAALMPVSGSRMHPNYAGGAGPLGPVQRYNEIMNGQNWMSIGWPVAHYCRLHVDKTPVLSNTFTGTYDSVTGDNA